MNRDTLHGWRIAARCRIARMCATFALIAAITGLQSDFAGGDGFRMASAGPRSSLCLVGGSGDERDQAAYVRTVAAGFTHAEPAAGVLFAALAMLMGLRRRPSLS